MLNKTEIINSISRERLETYRLSPNDTVEDLVRVYLHNIQLSEALYPALALLEVTLRNRLNNAIEKNIKPEWLIKEIKNIDILQKNEYEYLEKAGNKLTKPFYKQNQLITK